MNDYSYVAVTREGKKVKGTFQAKDEDAVRQRLKRDNMLPVSIKEQSLLTRDITIGKKGVKPRDLSIFCRQFTSIINAGVTMTQALQMLADQTENKVFAKAIRETKAAVEKGETLGNAMRLNRKIFPSMLVNMVDAGEQSGSLDITFGRMGLQFEKSSKVKSLVRKAMIYPIVIGIVAVIVIVVMSVLVIPQFAEMFETLGTELPFMTRAVMALSDFIITKWYIAIGIIVGIVVLIKSIGKSEAGEMFFGKLKMKVPIFGKLMVKNYSANFSRTMSTLISAGISITAAIDITSRALSNAVVKKSLERAKAEVEQGVSLSEPLRRDRVFPLMVPQMLSIGEETGNVEGMLDKVAEYYEDEVEITAQSLTALMEPLIIVVLGVIVGVLVFAMYQPMISMYGDLENL